MDYYNLWYKMQYLMKIWISDYFSGAFLFIMFSRNGVDNEGDTII